ncbi:MAG: transcription antitermination factor NusB [Oscillospiraceae bacterium]|nr:transcription antitermination factor NusB [Oscillospiraceae bacterium]
MNRHQARRATFTLIYQHSYGVHGSYSDLYTHMCVEEEIETNEYIAAMVTAMDKNLGEIDTRISTHAKGWDIGRISRVTLSILRLSLCEMAYCDVPREVSINEAVELAKEFDTDEAPPFINGVLDKATENEE